MERQWVTGDCWLGCERTGMSVIWLGPVQWDGRHVPGGGKTFQARMRPSSSVDRTATAWPCYFPAPASHPHP
ncbi:hypothetical protein GCM10009540_80560 [Streptomyces turgidiscabies]